MAESKADSSKLDIEKQQLIDLTPTSSSIISCSKSLPSDVKWVPSDVKWRRVSRRRHITPPPPLKPMKPCTVAILTTAALASLVVLIVTIVIYEQSCRSGAVRVTGTNTNDEMNSMATEKRKEKYKSLQRIYEYIEYLSQGKLELRCDKSTGYCWCVNKNGDEIPGTRRAPTEDKVNCYKDETPSKDISLTKCQREQKDASNSGLGRFVPECDSNGGFKPLQCHGSTGYCWCVDMDGEEIPGTRRRPTEEILDCNLRRHRRAAEKLYPESQVIYISHHDEQEKPLKQASVASSWQALGEICGKPVVGPTHDGVNIINGEDVNDIRRWPWAAYLGNPSSSFYCGAELITSQWVLTAAHCVTDQKEISVTLGTSSRKYQSPSATKIYTSLGFIHPDYNSYKLDNDVALLKLSEPVRISDYIRPVCLANSTNETRLYSSGSCWKIGWGNTVPWFSSSSDILQEINTDLISPEDCLQYYPNQISENMICSSHYGRKGACSGDSGGPTMCKNPQDAWDLVGITSWGTVYCGNPQSADVMARVSTAHDWIVKTIDSNGGPGDIIG